jgi:hypothetical protein
MAAAFSLEPPNQHTASASKSDKLLVRRVAPGNGSLTEKSGFQPPLRQVAILVLWD